MAELAVKNKISSAQLAILISTTSIGAQVMLGTRKLVEQAGYMTWLSVLSGGLLFFGATFLMLKLAQNFPELTLAKYLPQIWGKKLGGLINWIFNLIFLLQTCTILLAVSKAITVFLFDRTPPQVIALGMLIVVIYLTLHDLGTVLRVAQVIFWGMTLPFTLLWLISLFNFQPENLQPLFFKPDLPKVLPAAFQTWNMFSGYELILFLLPFTNRGSISLTKSIGCSFGCMTVLFLSIIIISIGVLTVDGVKSATYPTMTVISSVELPGTFLERLETYLVLAWIPVVFDTLAIMIWTSAQMLKEQHCLSDHRPIIFILTPILYTFSMLIDSAKIFDDINKITTWLGLFFSLVIIPVTLLVVWIKKRGKPSCSI